jgi:hypothetical protein
MKRDQWQQYRREAAQAYKEACARQRGSHGAASAVRHIDPATITVPEIEPSERRVISERDERRQALHDHADKMLRNDMRRRFSQKAGDRAYFQIKAERYASPEAKEVPPTRAQRKRMRRKKHNASKQQREATQHSPRV